MFLHEKNHRESMVQSKDKGSDYFLKWAIVHNCVKGIDWSLT